jgi:hypothetical protein
MAELYQVYGGLGFGGNNGMEHFSEQEEEEQAPPPVRRSERNAGPSSGGSVGSVAGPKVAAKDGYQSPQTQQAAPSQGQGQGQQTQSKQPEGFQNMYRRDSYSFFDKMAMKRTDVVKLAVFSLVIVLAISIDRIGTHYLTKYITDNIFTNFQEFMIRLSYPIIVFLVIWIVKSM